MLYQDLLANLEQSPKSDFLEGANGAVKLSQEKLDSLDALQKNVALNRQLQVPIAEQIQASSKTLLALVYGKEKEAVNGVTYKEMKLTLDSINESRYFDVKPEVQEPEPVVEAPQPTNVQMLEQIPVDQTTLQPQFIQPVQFLQDSTIVQDPAIVSMQPVAMLPPQYVNGGDLHVAQGKFETHIPTQTYTNPNYANYGGGFVQPLPVPLASGKLPQTNQPINQTQFIQPAAQENNNSANQTFDQNSEYAANMEHLRKSNRIHKNYNDDNNYNQGFRPKGNRGRGGYRGPRNQGANSNGIHQPREKKNYNGSANTNNQNNKFTNGS